MTAKPAVILLSGGLDSATTAAIARHEGFKLYAMSVDYGQRHRCELAAAKRVARALPAASHRIVKLDLSASGGFGHSALTDDIAVPKEHLMELMGAVQTMQQQQMKMQQPGQPGTEPPRTDRTVPRQPMTEGSPLSWPRLACLWLPGQF